MSVNSSFCCLCIWIFVSEALHFLSCIIVIHFIGAINQHYLKLSNPIWNMWLTVYCHIEGSLSLKDALFSFAYTYDCSATRIMSWFCTVLFNLAQCNLALLTDVQDKSTYLNTKFKEETSSYVWINTEM